MPEIPNLLKICSFGGLQTFTVLVKNQEQDSESFEIWKSDEDRLCKCDTNRSLVEGFIPTVQNTDSRAQRTYTPVTRSVRIVTSEAHCTIYWSFSQFYLLSTR